jgi:hypothetical protein
MYYYYLETTCNQASLEQKTDYPDSFLVILSTYLKLRHNRFLSHPFQIID